ncbi:MAG: peptidase M4 [Reyranellaceae bacterium]
MATRKNGSSAKAPRHPWLKVPTPTVRALQVYAVDPSSGRYSGNCTTVHVPWEKLKPGPTGRKIGVIDYDPAHKCYYPPVDLDDPLLLVSDGLNPSESDPRFHQQMVYAIASRTIQMFETALGRDIHWRRADRFGDDENDDALRKKDDIRVLKLYPHAMHQANAYYSPQAHGILFGYFKANNTGQGRNLPGQRIFTCLSQDIIAHEVTHAVIDGIRTYFTEPTNPDVLAFHEGFADLCALFAHFSHKAALIETIRSTGGQLYQTYLTPVAPGAAKPEDRDIGAQGARPNPLVALAKQFGEARGSSHGLRSALGSKPNSGDINTRINDSHFRGSILVAAVFDAYFTVYMGRAEGLFRVYRAGGGTRTDDVPVPLAELLAGYASETATTFFRLCARALDYCPPVDVTFGDFLRALITVSKDLDPVDNDGIRDALMEGFRLRGIYAESASFYSEDALSWPRVPEGALPAIDGLVFGSPNGLTSAEKDRDGDVLRKWASDNREKLGLDPTLPLTVPSFHPVFRTLTNGSLRMEMVIEIIQSRTAAFDPHVPDAGAFPFRGGVTLIVEAPEMEHGDEGHTVAKAPVVRFAIAKSTVGSAGKQREEMQRSFAIAQGLAAGDISEPGHFQANFGLLHEEG